MYGMCMFVYMFECVCFACVYMLKPEVDVRNPLIAFPPISLRQELSQSGHCCDKCSLTRQRPLEPSPRPSEAGITRRPPGLAGIAVASGGSECSHGM